jgi:RNA polymerase sigma factor (sigma-70 family)
MPYLRTDRELLQRFRRGEREALARVYWAYVDAVVRTGRFGLRTTGGGRVPGVTRAEDLPDLVQEVFSRAFAAASRAAYDGIRDYTPYLVRLTANQLVDRHRKLGREVVVDASDLEGVLDVGTAADESPVWLDPELVRQTQAYVSALGSELGAIYQQRFVAGLSQRDAAVALGLSRQRLRTLEARLRQGLEERLGAEGAAAAGRPREKKIG